MKRSSGITLHCEPHIAAEIGVHEIHRQASRLAAPARAALKMHDIFEDKTTARIQDTKRPRCQDALHGQDMLHGPAGRLDAGQSQMYDGFEMCKIASEKIARQARDDPGAAGMLDVVFTDTLIATFDHEDNRHHARTIVGANPFVISIPGITEAPAKPREYYVSLLVAGLERDMLRPVPQASRGLPASNMRTKFDFTTRNDPRLRSIAEGLMLQAVSYHETGEAFCTDRTCRIYNAHWQSDLIRTQVAEPKLCGRHQKILGPAITNAKPRRGLSTA